MANPILDHRRRGTSGHRRRSRRHPSRGASLRRTLCLTLAPQHPRSAGERERQQQNSDHRNDV